MMHPQAFSGSRAGCLLQAVRAPCKPFTACRRPPARVLASCRSEHRSKGNGNYLAVSAPSNKSNTQYPLNIHNSSLLGICGLAALAVSLLHSDPAHAEAQAAYVQELQQIADAYIPGVVGDSPLREGFVSGFLLILFSEIGDKTFFIAVLLALKQSQSAVFAGTFGALAVMTVVSVGLGQALHKLDALLPQTDIPFDDLLAVVLLLYFGLKTLQDAAAAGDTNDEKEEAEEAVAAFGSGGSMGLILSTFALVFAAEWGDKSFLATIALSAASSPLGVVLGAIAGHGVATGMAVVGGSMLSKVFSERALQYTGGVLFLVFAAATAVDIFK